LRVRLAVVDDAVFRAGAGKVLVDTALEMEWLPKMKPD
jgi:hypothetical protein